MGKKTLNIEADTPVAIEDSKTTTSSTSTSTSSPNDVLTSTSGSTTTETTTTSNGNTYSSSNNQYKNVLDSVSYDANSYIAAAQGGTKALTNTGSGTSAASGTTYSWDQKATEQAGSQYSQDVLTAKQNALTQRQTLESNAVNYQTQSDMTKYQQAQEADKVGWTGGYVLDQNQQEAYLKASIQSQMYGAMELQKYGLDTSLAAARLSYDANQKEYALKYYQQAQEAAVSEGNLLGTYFSPEVKDELSQLSVAQSVLQEAGIDDTDFFDTDGILSQDATSSEKYSQLTPEQKRAIDIKSSINSWFKNNGISKAGVLTASEISRQSSLAYQIQSDLYTKYAAADQATQTKLSEDSTAFIVLDENGDPYFDGVSVETKSWTKMTGEDILNYVTDKDGNAVSARQEQLYAYLDDQLTNKSVADFTSWLKNNEYGTSSTDSSGNVTYSYADVDLKALYLKYLTSSNVYENFISKIETGLDTSQKSTLEKLFNNYQLTVTLPDGTETVYTVDELRSQYNADTSASTTTTTYSDLADPELTTEEKTQKASEIASDILSKNKDVYINWNASGYFATNGQSSSATKEYMLDALTDFISIASDQESLNKYIKKIYNGPYTVSKYGVNSKTTHLIDSRDADMSNYFKTNFTNSDNNSIPNGAYIKLETDAYPTKSYNGNLVIYVKQTASGIKLVTAKEYNASSKKYYLPLIKNIM